MAHVSHKADCKKQNETGEFDQVAPGSLKVFREGKHMAPLNIKMPPLLHIHAGGENHQVGDVSVFPPKPLFEVGEKALLLHDKHVITDSKTKEPVCFMKEKIMALLDDMQITLDTDSNKVHPMLGNMKQKTKGLKNEKGEDH